VRSAPCPAWPWATPTKPVSLPWSCLDYRHTFGSQLAQRGVNLYKISTLMDNSPEICRRHYATLTPDTLQTEVEFGGSASAAPLIAV